MQKRPYRCWGERLQLLLASFQADVSPILLSSQETILKITIRKYFLAFKILNVLHMLV